MRNRSLSKLIAVDDAEQFDVGNATEAMWRDLIMESRLSSML